MLSQVCEVVFELLERKREGGRRGRGRGRGRGKRKEEEKDEKFDLHVLPRPRKRLGCNLLALLGILDLGVPLLLLLLGLCHLLQGRSVLRPQPHRLPVAQRRARKNGCSASASLTDQIDRRFHALLQVGGHLCEVLLKKHPFRRAPLGPLPSPGNDSAPLLFRRCFSVDPESFPSRPSWPRNRS